MNDLLLWGNKYGWGFVILVFLVVNSGKIFDKIAMVLPGVSRWQRNRLAAQRQHIQEERNETVKVLNDTLRLFQKAAAAEKLERQLTQRHLMELVQSTTEQEIKITGALQTIAESLRIMSAKDCPLERTNIARLDT